MEFTTLWERKGIEQGIEKAKLDIAINMLAKGFSKKDIIELTGLSEIVLNQLLEETDEQE